jgi:putative peptidoglycan lipid II flippase
MMGLSIRAARSSARTLSFLRLRLESAHRAHFSIARGMVLTLLFVAVGRFAGAGREVAIAAKYGASNSIDAYLFAFNILSWPFSVWFGVLGVVLVPAIIHLRKDDKGALQRYGGGVLSLSMAMGIVLWALMWALMTSDGFLGAIGFPSATQTIIRGIAAPLAPLVPLGFLISFFSAWIMASGRFLNTLFEAIPPLVILAFVLASPGADLPALVWGTLAGFVLHLMALIACIVRASEFGVPRFASPQTIPNSFWRDMAVMGVGQAVMTATVVVDQVMAAPLASGSIAVLGYSNRLIALILSVGALTVSRATLPVFSAMRAAGDDGFKQVAFRWTQMLFLVTGLVALLAWWFAPVIVGLLFERGAFTNQDTQAVTDIFRFGLVQVPFYCAGLVLTSCIAASGRYLAITAIGVLSLAVKGGLNLLLIPLLGISGITLASGIMYAVSFAAMSLIALRSRVLA